MFCNIFSHSMVYQECLLEDGVSCGRCTDEGLIRTMQENGCLSVLSRLYYVYPT